MNKTFIFYILCFLLLLTPPNHPHSSQEHIASEILRLHVIANSDVREDQSIKLKVKDQVVLVLREKLNGIDNKEDAKKVIFENLTLVEEIARTVMVSEGYDYAAKASLGFCDFPIKQYGDLSFPAGRYEALRIQLGKGEGKNWWCVMFPSLCYVDETYDIITEKNKEQFRDILTEEEYNSLLSTENPPIFYKSKAKLLLDKLIDYFSVKG